MTSIAPNLSCPSCGEPLVQSADSTADVTFFECKSCGRRYLTRASQGLVFRWPHPIGVALYSFAFRSRPQSHHLSTAIRSLTEGQSQEQVAAAVREIERELEQPTQQVHQMLPGSQRSEVECREFLQVVLQQLRGVPHGDA